MKARSLLTLIMVSLISLSACDGDAMMSSKGFRLPDGDAQAGREAFLYMQCYQCHTLKGEELPVLPGEDPPYVELGGMVTHVKTYGELITAIINPSHKLATGYAKEVVSEDGISRMYVYNDYMTIKELNDIVMFLQPYYDVVVPNYRYPAYP